MKVRSHPDGRVLVDADLVTRAQGGDPDAFAALVEGHRRELELHCYRLLGSAQDAEDAVQETFLAAWQHIAGFEARSSIRTWLYRIATNRCLDALRSARRRQPADVTVPVGPYPQPNATSDVIWLEPYPDLLLERIQDAAPGPEARFEAREAISLAFVAALQLLPPRQRVVLVLRDVLGFRARQAAAMLDTTEESVSSALKHARAKLQTRLPPSADAPPAPHSLAERAIIETFVTAYQTGDVPALVALLTEDVVITTPLAGGAYAGPVAAARVFRAIFAQRRSHRLIPARANGQPAFGVYIRDPATGVFRANDLEEAARFVDPARYRENCVGFTHGFVDWQEAQKSVRQVWKGLPDLQTSCRSNSGPGSMVPCPARSVETRRTTDSSEPPCPDIAHPRPHERERIRGDRGAH